MESATAIIGILISFLVIGVVGVYIGDIMIDAVALNASSDAVIRWYNTSDTRYITNVSDPWYANTGNGSWANISAMGADSMYSAQTTIIETFELGVLLCKIVIIVSIASIIFILLQRTGLIPGFGNQRY